MPADFSNRGHLRSSALAATIPEITTLPYGDLLRFNSVYSALFFRSRELFQRMALIDRRLILRSDHQY